jgi:hypothetical protein
MVTTPRRSCGRHDARRGDRWGGGKSPCHHQLKTQPQADLHRHLMSALLRMADSSCKPCKVRSVPATAGVGRIRSARRKRRRSVPRTLGGTQLPLSRYVTGFQSNEDGRTHEQDYSHPRCSCARFAVHASFCSIVTGAAGLRERCLHVLCGCDPRSRPRLSLPAAQPEPDQLRLSQGHGQVFAPKQRRARVAPAQILISIATSVLSELNQPRTKRGRVVA